MDKMRPLSPGLSTNEWYLSGISESKGFWARLTTENLDQVVVWSKLRPVKSERKTI